MKKIIIIGGAGFIGSHLSQAFSKLKHRVVIIDNFSTSAVKKPDSKFKVYNADAGNSVKINKIFKKEKPDIVFNLAGAINLRRQITDPLFIKASDILGKTKIVLDVCRKNRVKNMIFISSGGAIYENAKVIPTPECYLAHPTSLYGLASLMIEKFIELYCKNYDLSFTIPRLSNVYGPGQWESGIIPSLITKILKKESPIIYGKGTQTRDFIYIDDVIDALIVLAEKNENGIYNIGTGEETSLEEIFKLIENATGTKTSLIYRDSRTAETERSAIDIKRMEKKIGWHFKTNIEEGLLKTIKWYTN